VFSGNKAARAASQQRGPASVTEIAEAAWNLPYLIRFRPNSLKVHLNRARRASGIDLTLTWLAWLPIKRRIPLA
jgi:hypothetical protein